MCGISEYKKKHGASTCIVNFAKGFRILEAIKGGAVKINESITSIGIMCATLD